MGETGLVALAQNFAQKTENFYSFCRKDMVYSRTIKWRAVRRAGHGGGGRPANLSGEAMARKNLTAPAHARIRNDETQEEK